jgi:hypothetical protein
LIRETRRGFSKSHDASPKALYLELDRDGQCLLRGFISEIGTANAWCLLRGFVPEKGEVRRYRLLGGLMSETARYKIMPIQRLCI